jgi:hypothetical protein
MQVFRKKKASEKTYLAYTRGCHISEKTSKQQNFLQQKQKFGSNLSFFFTNLSSRKRTFTQKQMTQLLAKETLSQFSSVADFHPRSLKTNV